MNHSCSINIFILAERYTVPNKTSASHSIKSNMFRLLTDPYFLVFPLLFQSISANWQYKSRPDLAPPTLNITIPAASDISPGYIFIAPYSGVRWDNPLPHGPLQSGPYIFTSTGQLVWSGFGYISGSVGNFQVARWQNENVIIAFEASRNTKNWHGHGHAKILNGQYETIKEVRGGHGALLDIHEFHVLDEKTAVVVSYKPVPYELKRFGAGPKSQWIIDAIFQGL
jgi:hypothetical protein